MPWLRFQIANWSSAFLWAFVLLSPGSWEMKWWTQYFSSARKCQLGGPAIAMNPSALSRADPRLRQRPPAALLVHIQQTGARGGTHLLLAIHPRSKGAEDGRAIIQSFVDKMKGMIFGRSTSAFCPSALFFGDCAGLRPLPCFAVPQPGRLPGQARAPQVQLRLKRVISRGAVRRSCCRKDRAGRQDRTCPRHPRANPAYPRCSCHRWRPRHRGRP